MWTEQAGAAAQVALGVGAGVVGGLLVALARGQAGSNGRAALWLGIGLLVVAIGTLATAGTETTRIDDRTITVSRRALLGSGVRVIGLAQVRDVHINYLGRASSGVQFYSLRLDLADGSHPVLFGPGRFYPGGSSRAVAEERRSRLLGLVGGSAGR